VQRSLGGDEPPQTEEAGPQATQPDPAEAPSRTGRNLPVAIGVGAAMGGLVLLTLFTVKATFLLYAGAALAVALAELVGAFGKRGIAIPLIPVAAGGAAMLTCMYWLGSQAALAALALTVLAVFAWRLLCPPLASGALLGVVFPRRQNRAPQSRQRRAPPARSPGGTQGYVKDVTAGVFAAIYVPFLASFVVAMLAPADGARRVLTFVILTICSDIGGYFAGITLGRGGRHPMAPAISPKKTWEGFAGSAVACLAGGALCLPLLLHGHAWQGLLTGAAAVVAATLGDLAESMIKRDLDLKDMGTLLPGHGGILDRLDSLLACAPVIWLLLRAFIPAR
jgi:phosphatidate cytidylyltransferase